MWKHLQIFSNQNRVQIINFDVNIYAWSLFDIFYLSTGTLQPIDVAVQMATSGYLHCESGCSRSAQNKQMQDQLNNAPASYKGMMLSFAKGEYHYICSRNNNFSNRAQKASIVVE